MNGYERKKLDLELRNFTTRNFVRPGDCKNLDQIRFYVRELCNKIEEYEGRFNYVPGWAYSLLAQYNMAQNNLIHIEFSTTNPGRGI